jgi:hypothetical protein
MRVARILLICACALFADGPGALASGNIAPPTAEPLESVMVMQVDGWIRIDPEGGVADFTIDSELLPKLRQNLERTVRGWRFEPVVIDGTPRMVRARTRVVLAASQIGNAYRITVDNVTFPNEPDAEASLPDDLPPPIGAGKLEPPSWPRGLLGANVSGQVLLCLRIGAGGRVEEVVAVQSMLFDVKGKDRVLRDVIQQFERSALITARRWHFKISAERGRMSADERSVNVPVVFAMERRPDVDLPGRWRTIVRAPQRAVQWLPESPDSPKVGVSDVAAGEVMSSSSLVKLNTDVVGMIVM